VSGCCYFFPHEQISIGTFDTGIPYQVAVFGLCNFSPTVLRTQQLCMQTYADLHADYTEVLTAVKMRIVANWVARQSCNGYQRFGGTYSQGIFTSTLKTSETLVNFYHTARRYNPEDSHLRTHRRENFKSYLMCECCTKCIKLTHNRKTESASLFNFQNY
jgi:hypothetical protein